MAQNLNFKKVEVTGKTKEEALAQSPFSLKWDATQKYNKWCEENSDHMITDADRKQFMIDYLESKKLDKGQGAYITLQSAVKDTRERPYVIEDIKRKGARKYEKTFILHDDETFVELGRVHGTKADAKNFGKALYTEKGYDGNLSCEVIKQVSEGEDIVFRMKHAPSKNTQNGVYLVFGYEAD